MGNALAATTGEDCILKSMRKSQEDCVESVGHSVSVQNNCKLMETRRFTDFLDIVDVEEQQEE